MVGFALRSAAGGVVSVSTSQTFRSWVVVFRLCRPVEFLSLGLCGAPGLAPRVGVLSWGQGGFPVGCSGRDASRGVWGRRSGGFVVDVGILFSNVKCPSHGCWMTFWSLANSDFPTDQTFHQFHDLDTELDLHRWWVVSMEHLQRVCGMPAGNAYHSGHLVPSLFEGGLHVLWLLRPVSPNLHRLNDLPMLTFTELRGFHGAFATGVACQQGALTLPDTWFRPHFGTC